MLALQSAMLFEQMESKRPLKTNNNKTNHSSWTQFKAIAKHKQISIKRFKILIPARTAFYFFKKSITNDSTSPNDVMNVAENCKELWNRMTAEEKLPFYLKESDDSTRFQRERMTHVQNIINDCIPSEPIIPKHIVNTV
jgi:hypothetical protein